MTQASDIRPGDKIVLRDLKTVVSVIEVAPNIVATGILIYWLYEGERRHMVYADSEEIEVR